MPITGVFFIPSNPNASTILAAVTERLHTVLSEEPIHVGRWVLEHKLMRDTPSCLPQSASQRPTTTPRYMQFLSLTYYPNHGFIYTSQPPEKPAAHHPHPAAAQSPAQPGASSPMVMTTVPIPSSNALYQHFLYACQPFWCHRHTVTVPNGMVYDVGDFRVRVGDVRQTYPAARVRGTVIEIEWRGPSLVTSISALAQSKRGANWTGTVSRDEVNDDDDDSGIDMAFPGGIEEADVDAEYAATAALIREFWTKLGVDGAREAIILPGVGKEVKERLRELKSRDKQVSERVMSEELAVAGIQVDEDPDPDAGVDVARQFMEIFRFNR